MRCWGWCRRVGLSRNVKMDLVSPSLVLAAGKVCSKNEASTVTCKYRPDKTDHQLSLLFHGEWGKSPCFVFAGLLHRSSPFLFLSRIKCIIRGSCLSLQPLYMGMVLDTESWASLSCPPFPFLGTLLFRGCDGACVSEDVWRLRFRVIPYIDPRGKEENKGGQSLHLGPLLNKKPFLAGGLPEGKGKIRT